MQYAGVVAAKLSIGVKPRRRLFLQTCAKVTNKP